MPHNAGVVSNVYFELTRAFNQAGPTVVLASGQAVVYHRLAIMSKDGDWVIRETADACARVLSVLASHGARYRPGAPLDVRWLAGGWSSHFEFADERGRRVRCDFFSRPPRLGASTRERLFQSGDPLAVVDIESLIRMKQTQRAKDYAVIGELASRLDPARELLFTTDPDRLLALAPEHGGHLSRAAVQAALSGDRDGVVVALARERDAFQERDRRRLAAYTSAAESFIDAFAALSDVDRTLPDAHHRVVALAEAQLPTAVAATEEDDVVAQ